MENTKLKYMNAESLKKEFEKDNSVFNGFGCIKTSGSNSVAHELSFENRLDLLDVVYFLDKQSVCYSTRKGYYPIISYLHGNVKIQGRYAFDDFSDFDYEYGGVNQYIYFYLRYWKDVIINEFNAVYDEKSEKKQIDDLLDEVKHNVISVGIPNIKKEKVNFNRVSAL